MDRERIMNMVILAYMGISSVLLIVCSIILKTTPGAANLVWSQNMIFIANGIMLYALIFGIMLINGITIFDFIRHVTREVTD